jgi:hypothetical protein
MQRELITGTAVLGVIAAVAFSALVLTTSPSAADEDAATSNEMQPPAGMGELRKQLQAEAKALQWSPNNPDGLREGQLSACLPNGTSCVTIAWTAPLFVTEEMLAE